jgi:hypothetical protein
MSPADATWKCATIAELFVQLPTVNGFVVPTDDMLKVEGAAGAGFAVGTGVAAAARPGTRTKDEKAQNSKAEARRIK